MFLVANTCYIYHQHVGLKKVHSFLSELRQDTGERLGILEMQKEDRMYEIQFNGQLIDKELTVIDTDGKQKKIGDLIIDNPKLVFRFSELNCDKCIDAQIRNLNEYVDSIELQNIILLTDFQSLGYMRSFQKSNKVKFAIYNMEAEIDSVLVNIDLPYFFVLTPQEERIQCIFLIKKYLFRQRYTYLLSRGSFLLIWNNKKSRKGITLFLLLDTQLKICTKMIYRNRQCMWPIV